MGILLISLGLLIYFTTTAVSNAERVNSYKKQKQKWLSEDRAYLASRRQA